MSEKQRHTISNAEGKHGPALQDFLNCTQLGWHNIFVKMNYTVSLKLQLVKACVG